MEFSEFTTIYQITIVTVASVSTVFLSNVLQNKIQGKKLLGFIIILLVSAALGIANYFTENLIEKSPTVRKWIDEDNFIEGFYYDFTIKDSIPDHLSILNIVYQNKSYTVFGESYNSDGDFLSNYNSVQSTYSNKVLYFEWKAFLKNNLPITGIDQLQFGRDSDSYHGYYVNYGPEAKFISINGTKITSEQLKKYNNFLDVSEKGKFARDILEQVKLSLKSKEKIVLNYSETK